MNEEWSPEVLIEYLPDSFCWQWWMHAKKGRPQQTHNSYSIIPTSDFSRADLLIGEWWVFIVQQNWMKFDTSWRGLINWGWILKRRARVLHRHLRITIKVEEVWNWHQCHVLAISAQTVGLFYNSQFLLIDRVQVLISFVVLAQREVIIEGLLVHYPEQNYSKVSSSILQLTHRNSLIHEK